MLFNIADHEAEHYLDMIRNHASGWLPEMRKDGMSMLFTGLPVILITTQRANSRIITDMGPNA